MMYGSDIEALRRLGELLQQNAETLESHIAVIGKQVVGVPWFGPTGGMFEEEWSALHLPGMRAAAEGLRTAAQAAARNADAQEGTSADLGSTGSSGSGSTGSGGSGSTGSGSGHGSNGEADNETPPPGPVPLEDRKPTGEILDEYQVSDAKLIEWEPGWPASMFTDPVSVTEREGQMLDDLSLGEKSDFSDIKDDAFGAADDRFPSDDQNDDQNDAFRHAYWNALMTSRYGEQWAEDYGTAHEQRPGNPASREAMDLYNNEVGRRIAAENPDASSEELAGLVEQAVRNGEMVVVGPDGQSLVYSDQIAPGETGDAGNDEPAEGHDPDFNDVDAES
ncbi:hypothetical protein AB1046_00660 [Promicromonospora sp. Populi]|uniref:DUF6973 domain-containing protein n=1 Tax=Promicromonospora sp. Populi TaxID=3239420 RepID=UPI0034E2EED3